MQKYGPKRANERAPFTSATNPRTSLGSRSFGILILPQCKSQYISHHQAPPSPAPDAQESQQPGCWLWQTPLPDWKDNKYFTPRNAPITAPRSPLPSPRSPSTWARPQAMQVPVMTPQRLVFASSDEITRRYISSCMATVLQIRSHLL